MENPAKHIDDFNLYGYVSKYEPVAVDVIVRVDKKMLKWLGMKRFPDNPKELIKAIRDSVHLAYVHVKD